MRSTTGVQLPTLSKSCGPLQPLRHPRPWSVQRSSLGCRWSRAGPASPALNSLQGSRTVLLADRLDHPPIQVMAHRILPGTGQEVPRAARVSPKRSRQRLRLAPGRSRARSASRTPIRNGSRGSPTWFGRTAGGCVKRARKVAACATSHPRAATGACGVRGRRAGSAVCSARVASSARGGRRAGRGGEGAPASGVSVASSMASIE